MIIYGKIHFPFLLVIPLSTVGGAVTGGANDYILDAAIFDFSATHPDFTGTSTSSYTKPSYIASPSGGWLSVTNDPETSTFTDFFRQKPGKNYVFSKQLLLENKVGQPVTTHRSVDMNF